MYVFRSLCSTQWRLERDFLLLEVLPVEVVDMEEEEVMVEEEEEDMVCLEDLLNVMQYGILFEVAEVVVDTEVTEEEEEVAEEEEEEVSEMGGRGGGLRDSLSNYEV